MARTGHPNTVHDFTSQWRGTPHRWSLTANHSGTSFTTSADQILYLKSLFDIFRIFISASDITTYLSGVRYYDGSTATPIYENLFGDQAAATAAGYGLGGGSVSGTQGEGFTGGETTQLCAGLECCTILQAPVGLSSTGKPVFLKKFIHCAPASQPGIVDGPTLSTDGPMYAAALGNGTLYGSRVLCSATGKQGDWVVAPGWGNHQMPRRKKKVTSASLTSDLLRAAGTALSALEEALP